MTLKTIVWLLLDIAPHITLRISLLIFKDFDVVLEVTDEERSPTWGRRSNPCYGYEVSLYENKATLKGFAPIAKEWRLFYWILGL
jgi:hypothetical protein